jgi:hypothetical protein
VGTQRTPTRRSRRTAFSSRPNSVSLLPNLSLAKPRRHTSSRARSFPLVSLSLSLSLARPLSPPSCLVLVGWRDGWVAWRQAECDVSVPRRPAHIAAVRARSPTHHSLVDVSVHGCLRADGASCWQTRGRRRRKKRLRYGRDLLSVCTNSVA